MSGEINLRLSVLPSWIYVHALKGGSTSNLAAGWEAIPLSVFL